MSGTVGTNSGRVSGTIGAAAAGPTVSASDPAIDTNAAVGTQWANSASGEFFVCTDATTDENVWTNVGDGTGDISPWAYGGTAYGHTLAGGAYPYGNVHDRFSFTSDGDAADVGDTTGTRAYGCANKSTTHAYFSGGSTALTITSASDKVSFASGGDSVATGDTLTTTNRYQVESNDIDNQIGYLACGKGSGSATRIEKLAFASDTFSTSSASAYNDANGCAGNSSKTYGYIMGDKDSPYTLIQKYVFASESTGTEVGSLTIAMSGSVWNGTSSTEYGYCAGTSGAGPADDSIQKQSFSSDGDSTDVGNLLTAFGWAAGQSSTTYGYVSSGVYPTAHNVIQKYSFSSDGNSTDVGDVTVARYGPCGSEV